MRKILVVDDDDLVRLSVTAILAATGYEVVEAKDGLEALQLHKKLGSKIVLVIMDILMPRLDGISAAQMIKEIDPSAKVILMSGYSEQLPSDAKVDAFLPKPFRSKELLRTIQQVLQDVSLVNLAIKDDIQVQNQSLKL